MKVIDVMQKITNGEEFRFKILSENKTYHVYKDSQVFDEEDEDYVQWFIDYDWLNEEIEIIEEDKKIEMLIIGKDDVAWCEGNMKTDEEMVDIVLDIKDKINEIIMVINEMRKDK